MLTPIGMGDIDLEKIRARLGSTRTRVCVVTARDIRRFAQAIGDSVQTAPDGTLVAPLLFYQSLTFDEAPAEQLPSDGSPIELDLPLDAPRTVGGGSEYVVHRCVRAGETVTVTSRLHDVQRKSGKSGSFFVVLIETSFTDGNGERLARELASYVKRA